MGFLLSLDLSQVHTLCRRPNTTFRNHVLHREVSQLSPPSSFGWTLGSRELLLHLILLLVAMAEGGLLHHFTGPVQSLLQAPISYLLLAIFCSLLGYKRDPGGLCVWWDFSQSFLPQRDVQCANLQAKE
ncbi:hypothetical protein FQA47_024149 [Oryzias melastigma]|uniref:Uncharacterized protein n=1 Tax=Oryzias melastigma TaxID=30732 RepID=A0A834FF87_ORYME|nr:hypothetical protein FQA47_024149 [Oryzias melastigma]